MFDEDKKKFLKQAGWFFMFDSWHHPFLAKGLDLDSAYSYERFKRDEEEMVYSEENLHDDDFGG